MTYPQRLWWLFSLNWVFPSVHVYQSHYLPTDSPILSNNVDLGQCGYWEYRITRLKQALDRPSITKKKLLPRAFAEDTIACRCDDIQWSSTSDTCFGVSTFLIMCTSTSQVKCKSRAWNMNPPAGERYRTIVRYDILTTHKIWSMAGGGHCSLCKHQRR